MKKNSTKVLKREQTYDKQFSCKVEGGKNADVMVFGIPETLDDLRQLYNDEIILAFIVRQVIAHSCFSAVRNSAKKGETITGWMFALPQKREASALNKLSTEQRKQLSALSADKLEQLLQLLKD